MLVNHFLLIAPFLVDTQKVVTHP